RPARPRDSARLLTIERDGVLGDHRVSDLPGLLEKGDLLVFNDTTVIPARLTGVRARGEARSGIEATLNRRLTASSWSAFARPGKRLKVGDRIAFGDSEAGVCLLTQLDATVKAKGEGGEVILAFDLAGPDLDLAIAELGETPLPPYIASRRQGDAADREDYQTIYARREGSVAAPTAGLHFTPDLMVRLAARGIDQAFVTLHVGAGTFLPVKARRIEDHRMHVEQGEIGEEAALAIEQARRRGGRIVPVGTTSLRLLEGAADEAGAVRPWRGETQLFITPGFRFRVADGLFTNFHLPRSSLLMLVAAFCGNENVRRAYAHAIEAGYRFYSYGDASLIWRG
ncbi:MAG: tRNA preQ1(34) S-adenosylmethionine ribosyltransferase-isomerase QueA, partial [Caulobacteraceae bacterium]